MDTRQFSELHRPIALVVDDEPLILMDVSKMISDQGYSVVEITTADDALMFLTHHPMLELLVTDVQTPGTIDGFELARIVSDR